ncbi:hypothetical protein NIASO_16500 [Niabella soli DSM 19437]|uniref:Uncharacterized protein n=1 Tax=Niabella soli DSM 19437 TaxID=929713 RepID=W0F4B2_9BACT|nr:hypothetical protein NIASO_16500 [Niabella soli DSM 19437]
MKYVYNHYDEFISRRFSRIMICANLRVFYLRRICGKSKTRFTGY